MKKYIIIALLVLTTGIILILALGSKKEVDVEFYTIRENYSVVEGEDRIMTLNVISKTDDPLIAHPEHNSYQVKLDGQSFNLEDVKCSVIAFGPMFLVSIKAPVPDITDTEYISSKMDLIIINLSYKLSLDMGTFSILDGKSLNLISLEHLGGSYSKNDNHPFLGGINITFANNYEFIEQIRIGGMAYGMLSRAQFDVELDNEIDINSYVVNYNMHKIDESFVIGVKSRKVFIPIGYIDDALTRSGYIIFKIDGENYYFDEWPFMTTNPIYELHKDKLTKGAFLNV